MTKEKEVWYVTGASKGLGLALIRKLIGKGYRVAATSRNAAALKEAVGADSDVFLPLEVSLTDKKSVQESIATTVAHFGSINVVVNNAGYGLLGALEELSDAESRNNFDVNVFGSLNVIRQVLPYMRKQQSGYIFNVASIGGFTGGFPGFGIYCATKFAMQGFTESLAHEVKDFGIKATVVMPGYFRTNFLSDGSLSVPQNPIAEYTSVRESQNMHQNEINSNQPGDPEKAAEVMIQVTQLADPPIHLFLGQDAYEFAAAKIEKVQKDLASVREFATATAFVE